MQTTQAFQVGQAVCVKPSVLQCFQQFAERPIPKDWYMPMLITAFGTEGTSLVQAVTQYDTRVVFDAGSLVDASEAVAMR